MPILILVVTIAIILGVLLNRWFKKASQDDKRYLVLMSVWSLSGLGLLFLVVTGRFFHALGWGLMLLIALLISGASARRKRYSAKQGLEESMTISQAYDVLGLTVGASKAEIQKAYIDLIKKNHPDQGGSDFLSAKINQAHDVLMDPQRKEEA